MSHLALLNAHGIGIPSGALHARSYYVSPLSAVRVYLVNGELLEHLGLGLKLVQLPLILLRRHLQTARGAKVSTSTGKPKGQVEGRCSCQFELVSRKLLLHYDCCCLYALNFQAWKAAVHSPISTGHPSSATLDSQALRSSSRVAVMGAFVLRLPDCKALSTMA